MKLLRVKISKNSLEKRTPRRSQRNSPSGINATLSKMELRIKRIGRTSDFSKPEYPSDSRIKSLLNKLKKLYSLSRMVTYYRGTLTRTLFSPRFSSAKQRLFNLKLLDKKTNKQYLTFSKLLKLLPLWIAYFYSSVLYSSFDWLSIQWKLFYLAQPLLFSDFHRLVSNYSYGGLGSLACFNRSKFFYFHSRRKFSFKKIRAFYSLRGVRNVIVRLGGSPGRWSFRQRQKRGSRYNPRDDFRHSYVAPGPWGFRRFWQPSPGFRRRRWRGPWKITGRPPKSRTFKIKRFWHEFKPTNIFLKKKKYYGKAYMGANRKRVIARASSSVFFRKKRFVGFANYLNYSPIRKLQPLKWTSKSWTEWRLLRKKKPKKKRFFWKSRR